jgi:hypothetical protein
MSPLRVSLLRLKQIIKNQSRRHRRSSHPLGLHQEMIYSNLVSCSRFCIIMMMVVSLTSLLLIHCSSLERQQEVIVAPPVRLQISSSKQLRQQLPRLRDVCSHCRRQCAVYFSLRSQTKTTKRLPCCDHHQFTVQENSRKF